MVQLKKTIMELTEISKIQKSIQHDVHDVVISELMEEVCFSLENLIHHNNAKIITHFEDCPVIRFSIKNLRNIFYNVIGNAVKFSISG